MSLSEILHNISLILDDLPVWIMIIIEDKRTIHYKYGCHSNCNNIWYFK